MSAYNNIENYYSYIPIDYLRAEIKGINPNQILNNPLLNFHHEVDASTGNITMTKSEKYKDLVFEIWPSNRVVIGGSLHKYINEGEHNYNDFSQTDFELVIVELEKEFNIKPTNLRILVIELGVNIIHDFITKLIVKNCFDHKKTKMVNGVGRPNAIYREARHNKYRVKVYDKGLQYGLNKEILRFENHYNNWSQYRLEGIETLADFIACNKVEFVLDLVNRWQEIVFYDYSINAKKWNKYTNPIFWDDIKLMSDKTITTHRKRLNKLCSEAPLNIKEEINNLIIHNINSLQGVRNTNARKCKLTGVDIRNQKENSFLLSHSGLYHLLKFEPIKFQAIKNKFLSRNWSRYGIEKQVKEIAHNIRAHYNYKHRTTNINQLKLFEVVRNSNFS